MQVERRRYIVRGRVQGVGFRWFVRDLGEDLGLEGWVRNLSDGRSVETLAQGPAEALDRLAARMRQGPPGSFVSELMAFDEPTALDLDGFQIRR